MAGERNEAMIWARVDSLLSQEELADAVGVSRKTINAIERARSTPSVTLALAIARVLRSDVETLFARRG